MFKPKLKQLPFSFTKGRACCQMTAATNSGTPCCDYPPLVPQQSAWGTGSSHLPESGTLPSKSAVSQRAWRETGESIRYNETGLPVFGSPAKNDKLLVVQANAGESEWVCRFCSGGHRVTGWLPFKVFLQTERGVPSKRFQEERFIWSRLRTCSRSPSSALLNPPFLGEGSH